MTFGLLKAVRLGTYTTQMHTLYIYITNAPLPPLNNAET